MFLNMKNSFSLFELILTLAISTTIIIYSTLLVKDLVILNKTSLSKELAKLELNYTKIFIEKNKNINVSFFIFVLFWYYICQRSVA